MQEYQAILRLQAIDRQLMALNTRLHQLQDNPRLAACSAAAKKVKHSATTLLAERKDVELALEDKQQLRAHLKSVSKDLEEEAKGASANNYRRIQDIEKQLTSLAKRLEKTDFEMKALTQTIEKYQRAEGNAHALTEKLARELKDLSDAQTQDIAAAEAKVGALVTQRRKLMTFISSDLRETYKKLQKRFSGMCVEVLNGNVPSVCCVKLQPSLEARIQDAHAITRCPYCQRILVTIADEALQDPKE